MVAAQAFGQQVAKFIEVMIGYDPHPPFGTGTPQHAGSAATVQFEQLMAKLMPAYSVGSAQAFRKPEDA